jgi:hypothetical protein
MHPSGRINGNSSGMISGNSSGRMSDNSTKQPMPTRQVPVLRTTPAMAATPTINNTKRIKEKLANLEHELSDYIDVQDFESCVELKPRIAVFYIR